MAAPGTEPIIMADITAAAEGRGDGPVVVGFGARPSLEPLSSGPLSPPRTMAMADTDTRPTTPIPQLRPFHFINLSGVPVSTEGGSNANRNGMR
jgi:hypothetical protein